MIVVICWRRVAAALIAGALIAFAARSHADLALSAPPPKAPSVLDFEAEITAPPALPPGAEGATALAAAVEEAQRIAAESRRTVAAPAEAPPFVQAIAAAMKARLDSIALMADDRTYLQGEAGLHRASEELDRRAEAALAEHASEAPR